MNLGPSNLFFRKTLISVPLFHVSCPLTKKEKRIEKKEKES